MWIEAASVLVAVVSAVISTVQGERSRRSAREFAEQAKLASAMAQRIQRYPARREIYDQYRGLWDRFCRARGKDERTEVSQDAQRLSEDAKFLFSPAAVEHMRETASRIASWYSLDDAGKISPQDSTLFVVLRDHFSTADKVFCGDLDISQD